jgi:hypothetical protein
VQRHIAHSAVASRVLLFMTATLRAFRLGGDQTSVSIPSCHRAVGCNVLSSTQDCP